MVTVTRVISNEMRTLRLWDLDAICSKSWWSCSMGKTSIRSSKEKGCFIPSFWFIGPSFNVVLQLGPLVRQVMPVVEASPVYSMARSASGSSLTIVYESTVLLIGSFSIYLLPQPLFISFFQIQFLHLLVVYYVSMWARFYLPDFFLSWSKCYFYFKYRGCVESANWRSWSNDAEQWSGDSNFRYQICWSVAFGF